MCLVLYEVCYLITISCYNKIVYFCSLAILGSVWWKSARLSPRAGSNFGNNHLSAYIFIELPFWRSPISFKACFSRRFNRLCLLRHDSLLHSPRKPKEQIFLPSEALSLFSSLCEPWQRFWDQQSVLGLCFRDKDYLEKAEIFVEMVKTHLIWNKLKTRNKNTKIFFLLFFNVFYCFSANVFHGFPFCCLFVFCFSCFSNSFCKLFFQIFLLFQWNRTDRMFSEGNFLTCLDKLFLEKSNNLWG